MRSLGTGLDVRPGDEKRRNLVQVRLDEVLHDVLDPGDVARRSRPGLDSRLKLLSNVLGLGEEVLEMTAHARAVD